jgi:hypothetical protein
MFAEAVDRWALAGGYDLGNFAILDQLWPCSDPELMLLLMRDIAEAKGRL